MKIKELFYYLLSVCLVIVLVIPIILQYTLNWGHVSVYGIYLILYTILQMVFALINNNYLYTSKENKYKSPNENKMNVLMVGYKEDINYYKKCLNSLRDLRDNVSTLNKIYIVIDGNDPDDQYMADITKDIFYGYKFITINLSDSETASVNYNDYTDVIRNYDIICISQKHKCKRDAMYTGFKMTLLENNKDIKTIFCTDSDTDVDVKCLDYMFKVFDDERVGCVTGNLGIYNKYDSVMSFLSSVRYWYAFNLERAYQSFNGYVLCISGPIGMYRLSSLEKVIDEWKNQTFLGKTCTYGDDRHLTNKILGLGERSVYMSYSCADTETPTSIYRFYKQQIRWNKSAYRELLWSLNVLHKHSLFLIVDLVYMLVYPYIIMGYILYILYNKMIVEFMYYSCILLFVSLIKSVYGFIVKRSVENMFYFLYGIIYISIVFPAKIYALININDTYWGTSSRKVLSTEIGIDIIPLVLWNLILISGIVYCVFYNINGISWTEFLNNKIHFYNYSFSLSLTVYILTGVIMTNVLGWITMWMYIKIKRRRNMIKESIKEDTKIKEVS